MKEKELPTTANKSLQELENSNWGDPQEADTRLVETCLKLRRLPLKQFSVENLRMLIGQNIGLKFLIPMALNKLQQSPFAEGDLYPGDLLCSVLHVEKSFWDEYPEYYIEVQNIVQKLFLMGQKKKKRFDTLDFIKRAYEIFQSNAI